MKELNVSITTQPVLLNKNISGKRAIAIIEPLTESLLYICDIQNNRCTDSITAQDDVRYENIYQSLGVCVDTDKQEDLVFIENSGELFAFNESGKLLSGYPTKKWDEPFDSMSKKIFNAVDINNDGKKELLLFMNLFPEGDQPNTYFDIIDLKGQSLLPERIALPGRIYGITPVLIDLKYLLVFSVSRDNKEIFFNRITLAGDPGIASFPVELKNFPDVYSEIKDNIFDFNNTSSYVSMVPLGVDNKVALSTGISPFIIIIDYMTGKEHSIEIKDAGRITHMATGIIKGKLSSKEVLYVLDEKEKKVYRLDKKLRVKKHCDLNLDSDFFCSNFYAASSNKAKINYIVSVFEKRPHLGIDETFEKYGDPEYEKKKKKEIAQFTYDRLKTWDFPPEHIEANKRALTDAKMGYLDEKFSMEELVDLQSPSPIINIIILADDGNKIQIVSRETIKGYTTYYDNKSNTIRLMCYRENENSYPVYILCLREQKNMPSREHQWKSIIKLIPLDKLK
ncbi:MAG: hypothetical protein GY754_40510 [bacterium]|nr:hypothetical protein [bacterium]